ncbi:type III-B CRISPR module RAMP protein Cmr4 [Saccharopolyspora sp. NPDC000359]|uniref:type III-B CRISPR module RAMP protein Cmr4 n=1 Tax=Saccharopolyspora sp. NPDC000359 TaxID=3154251 RepID=UPI00332A8ED0
MERRLLVLFAETPIHAGGSESTGVVDLPIQREASTGLPVVWGQSLKGALRDAARDAGWDPSGQEKLVFGSRPPGTPGDDGQADDGDGTGELVKGHVSFGDAQLLLFPAPTLINTYAWATSPQLVSRLIRKAALTAPDTDLPTPPPNPGGGAFGTKDWEGGQQVIGPNVLRVERRGLVEQWAAALAKLSCPESAVFGYTQDKLSRDVLYVADGVLSELSSTGTDVVPRVQLDPDKKTAKNLFYSEHLPAESVLTALLAGTSKALDSLTELLDGKPLQLGGDETIGKGLFWCRVHDAASLRNAFAAEFSKGPR